MSLISPDKKETLRPRESGGRYLLLSFLLPLASLLIALIWLKVTPFGENTLLISDADGLYVNYLAYFGRMVRGLEGFTYSFEKGLGGNMLPNIGITMLNPFFLVFALFGIRNYPLAFTIVCTLNCCASGVTMALFLAELYGRRRSNLIFSTSYALMGFSVANLFQVFFFTGVHMLPLAVLGLRRLLRGKSPLLYTLALGYAILTSYYFGYMLCVASVLFFLLYLWLQSAELSGRRRGLFLRYALASVCAGLLGAVIWLPAVLGIIGGRTNQIDLASFGFQENMPLLYIGAKFFTGANNKDELINGLPNVYVGILPLALVLLFFLNREIDRRKKAAAGLALVFYLLGFYLNAFNLILHGGSVTNWFNYRYSFVFSFLLLLIASYEWQFLDDVSFSDCKKVFCLLLGASVLVFSRYYGFVTGGEVVLDFVLLLMMFAAFALYRRDSAKNPRRIFELLILLLCAFQLTLNVFLSTNGIYEKKGWFETVSSYRAPVEAVAPLVNGLQKGDTDFYRMEINRQRSEDCGNDPMLYGYQGLGHSGSYERDFVRTGLAKLGVPWFDTRNYYHDGIPAAADVLLGVKYVIAQEDLSAEKDFRKVTDFGQVGLFQGAEIYDIYYDPDALPLAFLSNAGIESVETGFDDIFDNLNRCWAAISGRSEPVLLEVEEISFQAVNRFDGLSLSSSDARALVAARDAADGEPGVSEAQTPEFSAYIRYSWTAKADGPVFVYNRGMYNELEGASPPVLSYLGRFHAGDAVTGFIPVNADYVNREAFEEICGRFRAATADDERLHELAQIVKSRPSAVEKLRENLLRGSFSAEAGQKLMFTIPYDKGWTCRIDGAAVEIKPVLGVFMLVDAPEGEHSYEMHFTPQGLSAGLAVSVFALCAFLIFLYFDRRNRREAATPLSGAQSQAGQEEFNGQ